MRGQPLDNFPEALRKEFEDAFEKASRRFSRTLEYAIKKLGTMVKCLETPDQVDIKITAPIEDSLRKGVPATMPEMDFKEEVMDCIYFRRLTFEDETLKNIFKALCEQETVEGTAQSSLKNRIFTIFIDAFWDSDRVSVLYLEPSMMFSKALFSPGNQRLSAHFGRLTNEQKVIYDLLVKNYNQVIAQTRKKGQGMATVHELAEIVRRKYKFAMIKQYCERRARTQAMQQERQINIDYLSESEAYQEAETVYEAIRKEVGDTLCALVAFYLVLPGLDLPPDASAKFLPYKKQQTQEMGELMKILQSCRIVRDVSRYSKETVVVQCQRADIKFPSYCSLSGLKMEEHFDQFLDANISRATQSLFKRKKEED